MRFNSDKSQIKQLLKTADIINTIGGGISQSSISIVKMDDHYLITAKVPGVEANALGVDVVNHNLLIQHSMKFESETNHVSFPRVVASFPISFDVDHDRISAVYEEGLLKIQLPFNSLVGGYHRTLEIKR